MSLEELYDGETFRKHGHEMIDLLADHLSIIKDHDDKKVITYVDPDENYKNWDTINLTSAKEVFEAILGNSIHLHHPRYMGHQVTVPAPLAALVAMEGMLLNSGGAIYEMSAASSTLEKWVVDQLKGYFGFHQGDGIITSGGTLANLTALICARNVKAPENVWHDGQSERYAFMVSEEAHYCIDRAVRVMGWGDSGIIKIPVDQHYRMRTELLEKYYLKATHDGIKVLGVVGSAPTTSTGIYDDLLSIGEFCQRNNLWYHIDAAHGGPAAFSEKYKYLMAGVELADSITVDAHKMMMVPSLTTFLFFKDSKNSYKTFAQKAQYLWSAADEEWYNYGKRTMECTKIMLSTRVFAMIKLYGIKVFETYLDQCYDTAKIFANLLKDRPDFELAVEPDSNIVCFRYVSDTIKDTDDLNRKIRNEVLQDGHFYIVQTLLRDQVYLRVSIMNPFTEGAHLQSLLDYIIEIIKKLE